MAARLVIAPEAAHDLDDIWLYIARNDLSAADRFLNRLLAASRTLAAMPGLSRARDDLAPGLRSFPVGDFLIFYRVVEDGSEIVRVLHGARDLEQFF